MKMLRTPQRESHHRHQKGFTLIETLVTLALLAVLGTAMGTAFDVGIKVVGGHGVSDSLTSAHDQSSLEQRLGQDIARASCITIGSTSPNYGGCVAGFKKVTACATAVVCIGWPIVSTVQANLACDVAEYTYDPSGSSGRVVRFEYTVSYTAAYTAHPTLPAPVKSTVTDGKSVTLTVTAAPAGPWVSQVNVLVASPGTPPNTTLTLRPISSDPGSSAASIGSQGPPC